MNFRPYPEMVAALFKIVESDPKGILHASLGICGEAGEVLVASVNDDDENMVEELGDFRFYLQHLLTTLGVSIEHVRTTPMNVDRPYETESYSEDLVIEAANLLDLAKKTWVYGKIFDEDSAFNIIIKLVDSYDELVAAYGLTDDVVMDANQTKLAKRYPEGVYSNEAAIARADKVET